MFRKKLIWIVLLVTLSFMLVACAGGEAETPAEQPAVEEEAEPTAAPTEEPVEETSEEEAEPTEEEVEPTAEEAPAEAVAAEELFQQNCAKCHGTNRTGGRGPALLPSRLTEEASVYIDTITSGRGGMPSFEDKLSTEEIEALVAFLQTEPE